MIRWARSVFRLLFPRKADKADAAALLLLSAALAARRDAPERGGYD